MKKKPRLLGLDYGKKRIGLAVSDSMGWSAQPLGHILRDQRFLTEVKKLISEYQVEEIVVGLPRMMSGELGPMAAEAEKFGADLGQRLSLPVHFWDERLTTAESEKILISANVRREKRKDLRDQMAAALMLQSYMQSLRFSDNENLDTDF